MRLANDVPVARKNVSRSSGRKSLFVVMEESVTRATEILAVVVIVKVGSSQIIGNAGSH